MRVEPTTSADPTPEEIARLLSAINDAARIAAIRHRTQARLIFTPPPPGMSDLMEHSWCCEAGFDLDEHGPVAQGWADDALGAALACAENLTGMLAVALDWDHDGPTDDA